MTDLSLPSLLANPTHSRQEAGELSVATHGASAKSCDTVSVDFESGELKRDQVYWPGIQVNSKDYVVAAKGR